MTKNREERKAIKYIARKSNSSLFFFLGFSKGCLKLHASANPDVEL